MQQRQQSGGGRRRWASGVDMYRRVPADLTESSTSGSVFSYVAVFVMLVLFLLETKEYMQKRYVKNKPKANERKYKQQIIMIGSLRLATDTHNNYCFCQRSREPFRLLIMLYTINQNHPKLFIKKIKERKHRSNWIPVMILAYVSISTLP